MSASESLGSYRHAVVVCTRNRPDDVGRLMASLGLQECEHPFLVVLVDASDPEYSDRVRRAAESAPNVAVKYVPYPHSPSAARQRNYGVDLLSEDVEVVHFLDDDVTLEPGYLEALRSLLYAQPEVGGVGGRVILPSEASPRAKWQGFVLRAFLLESSRPGRVLPSGAVTAAQSLPLAERTEVECLAGCSASYRRKILESMRFDDRLDAHSADEDFDLSYRVHHVSKLLVEPKARLIHRISPQNRQSARESTRDAIVHRYWFLEKNIRHPFRKPAFWWRMFGSLLIATVSRDPVASEARKGILEGAAIVFNRKHPLLQRAPKSTA